MEKILLTSFTTWLPHQKSNASDDLLQEAVNLETSSYSLTFLRQLPVDIPQASERVITQINELQPDIVLCCGMAESRKQLSVESNASRGERILKASVDLDRLLEDSVGTFISHDAGKFVCEGLYYSVLNHLQNFDGKKHGLFIHVPVLTRNNIAAVMTDFELIMQRLASLT